MLCLTPERRDPHEPRSLRTKVFGKNPFRSPLTAPAHNFEQGQCAQKDFEKKVDSNH